MFGCWSTAAEVPGWVVTLLQRVRSVCNLIHAVFVFSSLSWCLHDSAVLSRSPRLLPAAPAPPRPAVRCHRPGHVLLLLLTMMQMIRVPNCWRPLTGYTGYRMRVARDSLFQSDNINICWRGAVPQLQVGSPAPAQSPAQQRGLHRCVTHQCSFRCMQRNTVLLWTPWH